MVTAADKATNIALKPEPVVYGAALDRDIAVYRWVCFEVGLPPGRWMLPLFDDRFACELFVRRGTSAIWRDFEAAFAERYPALEIRGAAAEAAVAAIPSSYEGRAVRLTRPEICAGWLFLTHLPLGVQLERNVPLPGEVGGNARRADFTLSRQTHGRRYIEVCGMLDAAGEARTADGARYLNRQGERLRGYRAAGLAPPLTIHAGELVGEARRAAVLERVLASLAEPA